MREKLQSIEDQRNTFTGTFTRYGIKNGFRGPKQTILLINIKDKDGNIICDHLWFNATKGFMQLNLTENNTVQFSARVKRYKKGFFIYKELDYKLSHPTKLIKIDKELGE